MRLRPLLLTAALIVVAFAGAVLVMNIAKLTLIH